MVLTQGAGKEEKVYAMQTDYCKIFSDHVNRLYTLALLLTADYAKAEQCFVAGLEDCVEGNPVFREWGKVWAARMIIKNAIRMISSSKNETITNLARQSALEADVLVSGITGLPPFERVAYVTSVLEGYSDRECSLMLDCTVDDVAQGRIRAIGLLAESVCLEPSAIPTLV